jgi:hypothetical protein
MLRKDGSPRISGIECAIEGGELQSDPAARAAAALDLI